MDQTKTLADSATFVHGGYTYTLAHMPAREGLRAGAKLLAAAGPALAGMGEGMLGAAAGLVRNPELGETAVSLAEAFAQYTQVTADGGKTTQVLSSVFDAHFAGRYDALLKWLAFAIEWDLDSFLGEVRAQFAGAVEKAAAALSESASKSPPVASSTGRSGK